MEKIKTIIKNIKDFFHVHKWEYEKDFNQTVRRCKCGEAHVNKRMVSQIYGGEHWYDYKD